VATSVAGVENRGFMSEFFSSDSKNAGPGAANATQPANSTSTNNATQTANATQAVNASDAANASPIIITQNSSGKKIQITIIKEFGQHVGEHAHSATDHAAGANVTSAQGTGQDALAGLVQQAGQVNIDNNAFTVDNSTVANLLQQLLSGNIQNVQTHGGQFAVPPSGKPVAVVYSASMHVVDLGILRPGNETLQVAVAGDAHQFAHQHAHAGHLAHQHPGMNHTLNATAPAHNHTAPAHAGFNHTALLESIMSPLISLTHLGGSSAGVPAAPAPVQTPPAPVVASQPAQMMQPVVVMMPVPQAMQLQQQLQHQNLQVDSSAQLNNVLQSLLAAKQQMIAQISASSAQASHDASNSIVPTHAPIVPPTTPIPAAPAVPAAQDVGVQVVSVPHIKKKIQIEVSSRNQNVV